MELNIKKRIVECARLRRWYQTPNYNGIRPRGHFDDGKTNPISYGVGKWENYIKPLLKEAKKKSPWPVVFCDIGCSAGEYLVYAVESGYRRVIGVEAAQGGFSQLLLTKDVLWPEIEAYNNSIGAPEVNIKDGAGDLLDLHTFPMCDVILMSNIHYHFTESDLVKTLNKLADKTQYLIVVTDERAQGVVSASSQYLLSKAEQWDVVATIKTKSTPSKERNLTSILFKSKRLYRLRVDECFEKQVAHSDYNREFYAKVFPDFIKNVLRGLVDKSNYQKSIVYNWSISPNRGSQPWPPDVARERTLSYINQVKTIKEHGQEMPILDKTHFDSDLFDGNHRIAVLKYFGIKWVFAEKWEELKRLEREWGYK